MTEREFADQIQQVKVPGGTVAREKLLARLGAALLVLGPVVALVAYSLSHSTENALQQRDAIVVGAVAVTLSVAGLALFLRYSLGALLRLWLARLVAERENP
jgi:ABC-type sulfate transport system permease component